MIPDYINTKHDVMFFKNSRTLVNAQLNAVSNLHALGSCVKCPDATNSNNDLGSCTVPSLLLCASALSSQIAATNMAQQHYDAINNDTAQCDC